MFTKEFIKIFPKLEINISSNKEGQKIELFFRSKTNDILQT